MKTLKESEVIVIKVGTSSLTHENGKINIRKMENLCKIISDYQNAGKKMILVSSGAISVGMGKLGMRERPRSTSKKQALASVGQCELMFMYDKLFGEYNRTVAQVLLTADVTKDRESIKNVENTFNELIEMDIIPVVNENDTVSVYELEGNKFGDNDTLSAIVATIVKADALVILTDVDGLYTGNPKKDPSAVRIPVVKEITKEIEELAGGAGSSRGTGGMETKIKASKIATKEGINCYIIDGENQNELYKLFDGEEVGTVFLGK